MICTNKICQLITTILLALYARSLYYDRYKLRSFPFIAKYFFDIPSLHFPSGKGKIAVVTGANSGLGLETTRQMALSGVHVVMACRSLEKCEAARRRISKTNNNDTEEEEEDPEEDSTKISWDATTCMKMNLASLASVRTFVKQFLRQFNNTLDILVLNGGIISPHVITEEDQVEKSFLVNYLSHFLLTQLLLPTLEQEHGEDGRRTGGGSNTGGSNTGGSSSESSGGRERDARIVSVTSDAHAYSYKEGILGGGTSLVSINDERNTNTAQNYAQAKLANIMLVRELTYRLPKNSRVYANAARAWSLCRVCYSIYFYLTVVQEWLFCGMCAQCLSDVFIFSFFLSSSLFFFSFSLSCSISLAL